MDIRPLDDRASAAPQIAPGDMPTLKADGYGLVVNNRPDGEEQGQPSSAEMERAAADAGLAYAYIPVGRDGLTDHPQRLREAMDASDGKALLFCRSGTRSTTLWALAEAGRGRSADELVSAAAAAGYDLGAYRATLDGLAKA